jgi:DnaK suppressor protein
MTGREVRRFKRVLDDLRAELIHTLENSVDRLAISQSADPMDQMRDLSEQEMDSRSISLLTARLCRLEDALKAIDAGNFGLCASCDCEIPINRLKAIPWSLLCVRCQESADAAVAERDHVEKGARSGYAVAG